MAHSGRALLFSSTIFGLNPSPVRPLKGSCCLQLSFVNISCNQILSQWFAYSSNSSKLFIELAHKRTFLWYCITVSASNHFVQLLACNTIFRLISSAGWLTLNICIHTISSVFLHKLCHDKVHEEEDTKHFNKAFSILDLFFRKKCRWCSSRL